MIRPQGRCGVTTFVTGRVRPGRGACPAPAGLPGGGGPAARGRAVLGQASPRFCGRRSGTRRPAESRSASWRTLRAGRAAGATARPGQYARPVTPEQLRDVVQAAVSAAVAAACSPSRCPTRSSSSAPKNREHGDYATNVALRLAKAAGRPPREVAELLATELRATPASPRSTSPARASSTSPSRGRARAARRAPVDRGRGVRPHRRAGRAADQPGVRLGQPDRPAAHRRHPVGRGRRRARPGARRPAAPRSTREYYFNDAGAQIDRFARSLQAAAHGRAGARGRLRRRLHRRHRRPRSSPPTRACSSCPTTSSWRCSARAASS